MKAIWLLPLFFISCYSLEKQYNYGNPYLPSPKFLLPESQFEEGEPNVVVDSVGHYFFSIPSKLILWNRKVDNHRISNKSKQYLIQYIQENNIRDVKVRFNQYAPLSEWGRLVDNDSIDPLLKYTAGSISLLAYTFLPGRLLSGLAGGDHFNPFTNTINVYSDLPTILIHEGGHAKDFAQRKDRSLYAVVYSIPVLGALYHEARATDDAMNYFAEKKDIEQIEESYEILVPAYSTYLGGALGDIVLNPVTSVAVIPGHFYGRYKKESISAQMEKRKSKRE